MKTGPKGHYEEYIGLVTELYETANKTDEEIAQILPIEITSNTVYKWRKKAGVDTLSRGSRASVTRKRTGKVTYEDIKDDLPRLWKESEQWAPRRKKMIPSAMRVGKTLGVSQDTANKWLKQAGILGDRINKNTLVTDDEIKRLYVDENMSLEEIQKKTTVPSNEVSKRLKEMGVVVKTSQARRSPEEQTKIVQKIVETKSDPEYKKSIMQKNMERWGRNWPNQKHLPMETVAALSSPESLLAYIEKNNFRSTVAMQEALGCGYSTLEVKLKRFGLWDKLDHYTSKGESQVVDYLASLGVPTEKTRKPLGRLEIDAYSKENKIGVEYNGSYWHSDIHKNRRYHQEKSRLALSRGIFLYHIFEYEWDDPRKQGAIKSQLRNLFGKNENKIGARKTQIREISVFEKNSFLDLYHVQGRDHSSVKIGLFSGDDLLAVMTFKAPSQGSAKKKHQWELSRFATKDNWNISGGASKLFSHFVKENYPESIISYSDNAKTRGGLYESLGFDFSHDSDPNYVWTDFEDVKTRYQTQMKGEDVIMREMGYVKVFDCGSKVWEWKR